MKQEPKPPYEEQPRIAEPILATLTPGPNAPPDPEPEELLKGRRDPTLSTAGTPPAGESSIAEAKRHGIVGWFQLLGPGLVTGASDDDPSGIGTYSQVGSQFGFGMLWTALFSFPLMVAVQEMCGRIALHTREGLGVTLRRRFPAWLVIGSALALFVANTINIAADLGAVATGGELLSGGHVREIWLVVPAAVLIGCLQFFATYSLIFKLFKYLTLALFAYVITLFVIHPPLGDLVRATFLPHLQFNSAFITGLVAVLGTTISPYLFFWQASSEVSEMNAPGAAEQDPGRLQHSELRAARIDIVTGMAFSQVVMFAIIATSGGKLFGQNIQTATDAARALQPFAGQFAFVLFSIGLIGTGLLAIPILAGSAAYALKEVLGIRGNLAVKPRYRPTFYAIIGAAMVVGTLLNFLGVNPITALFITAVINGILAPPLLVLITLVAQNRTVMGEHVSGLLSRTVCWVAAGVMTLAVIGLAVTSLPLGHS